MNKDLKPLPKLEELYKNVELSSKCSQLQILLNQAPSAAWIKKHPIYKNEYIPIEVIEWLLTSIFIRWWVDIKDIKIMLNSAVVTVRLNYIDPLTGETNYQEGAGADNFQLKSGSKVDDFSQVQPNAVMLAVPIAESRAISDAADKIGKLFGKDLNRKNGKSYDHISDKFNRFQKLESND
jgi:hypothetical protein